MFMIFIPPAKRSLRGVYCFQPVRDSEIPRFRDSVIPSSFFKVLLCNFSSSCPILFKFLPHLDHHTLHVLKESRGWRVNIARVMPLCNFNCNMFAIVLIVQTLWTQLLLELSVYPFNTLQMCYRHIVDVHEELICRKKYFWQINSIFNLVNFRPLYILTIG